MNNELHIKVDENDFDVSYSCEDSCSVNIAGKNFYVEELKSMGQGVFSFSVNSKLHQIELEFIGEELLITKDGLSYTVKITDPTRKLLNEFIKQSGSDALSEGIVKAPMPGYVVKHYFAEGDTVAEGDKLVVVEAMKMENVLKAPVNGTLKTIRAKVGTAIEKNAVIIEIE